MNIDEAIERLSALREQSKLLGRTPIIGPGAKSFAVGLEGFELFESLDCVAIQLFEPASPPPVASLWHHHGVEFRPGDVCQILDERGIWRGHLLITDESLLSASIRLVAGDYFSDHPVRPYRIDRAAVGVILSPPDSIMKKFGL